MQSIILPLAIALAPGLVPGDTVPLYDDLGDHHHAITTTQPVAQAYFDQGLRLVYAFNHAEAILSFREALRHDSACAMCWWGIAVAYGPNINVGMDAESGTAAWQAAREALRLAPATSAKEQAFIEAIQARYGEDPLADRAARDSAWATALGSLARQYPDDDDAAVLYADALMNLSPWIYWTKEGKPRPGTDEVLRALEGVTSRNAKHAGACHLYIHSVEEHYPERAVPCADRLAGLMPGAGHIVHMPGHIYIRVGRYADAIAANQHAIHEDESFISDRNPQGVYPLGYYPHNYHFLNFAAMMAANEEIAIQSATVLAAKSTPDLLRVPGLAGSIQHYLLAPVFASMRFDRWADVLEAAAPPADLPYPTGLWHYGRGVALARQGEPDRAVAELDALRAAAAAPGLDELFILSYNDAASVLRIAEASLAGEIAAARKDWKGAIASLGEAVRLEDALVYIEPPEWPITPRQQLGRVQLLAGRHAAAERTFEEDLREFPENVWSLRGLVASLENQGRVADAKAVHERLARALTGDSSSHQGH
jgi:tetratricopeptide (TPR) repeat protein